MKVEFWVSGISEPKGSTRSFYIKKLGRTVTTSANRNLKGWEQRVATEAQKNIPPGFYDDNREVSYYINLVFMLPRPQSLPKRIEYHTKKPDIDKLIRAVLDALTGIAFSDDSQVTSIHAYKDYVRPGTDPPFIGPGVRIYIERYDK